MNENLSAKKVKIRLELNVLNKPLLKVTLSNEYIKYAKYKRLSKQTKFPITLS